MTRGFQYVLMWLGASIAALVVALAPVMAAVTSGQYVPVGPDSFYHARRILDTVADLANFFQFDTFTHVPEGNLVTWPWAYDFVMSLIVRAGLALHLSDNPLGILVHLPAFAFPIAILLMLSICRSLNLSTPATMLALLATAFFPLNQSLYSLGNIDHHFAEHLFVLGTLATTLRWLRAPESRARAITAGVVFGLASGVHTAEFALQIPLLATLFLMWLRRQALPRHAPAFALALFVAQLLIALPSLPLQRGGFDYYTLSWFQVYIAACTGTVVVLLARLPVSARHFALLAVTAAVLAVPTIPQVLHARDFFTNSIAGMDDISEVRSILGLWSSMHSFEYVASLYSWTVALLPLTLALCLWRFWRAREPAELHFWLAALAGIAMLVSQVRLQYFGSFALYLPWLVLLSEWSRARPRFALLSAGACAALLVALYFPAMKSMVFAKQILAGDPNYAVTRPLYEPMARECARHPGLMLADPDDGHYIRFHSKCSVIANNFLVTAQDVDKVREELRLLRLPARELAAAAPEVEYVYVRNATLFFTDTAGKLLFAPGEYPESPNMRLVRELLDARPDTLPPGFRMIYEMTPKPGDPPFARLFAIERAAANPLPKPLQP
jgi:hypothetical protein